MFPASCCGFFWLCESWRPEFIYFFAIQSVYFLFSIFKNWWHMHWVFVCSWSWRERSRCEFLSPPDLRCIFLLPWNHQTSAICVCLENIWTKKKKCTCVMNIYAFLFCAIKEVYMYEQFSVPFLVLVGVNSVYNLFEVNKCNSWFSVLFFCSVTYWSFQTAAVLRV